MNSSLIEIISRIPLRSWGDFALGGGFLAAGVIVGYYELRAVFTEHRSIAYDPDEPAEMTALRRICAWLFVVAVLFIAVVFFYAGSIGVRRCAIVQDPSWKC